LPAAAPPGRSTGPALALKPPPPSIIQNPAAEQKTMFMPGGPSAQAPAPASGDKTAILDDLTTSQSGRRSTAVPGMQVPALPANQTMVIGTPPGYKDRPPRKTWVVVLVVLLVAGLAGGGIAVAMMMSQKSGSSSPGPEPVEPGAVPPPDARPAAAPDAAPAQVEPILAKVVIETEPPGAEVWIDGTRKGVSPTTVELPPDGADHELVLRHPEAKEKTKTIKVTGDQTIRLELEKKEPEHKGSGGRRKKDRKDGDGDKPPPDPTEDDDLAKPPWMKK
jgi:hypothetical protein